MPGDREILAAELEAQLPLFIGTEKYYKLGFPPLLATDGVKYLADKAGAYWLVDIIASYQPDHGRRRPFQVWRLTVNEDTAVIEMGEDTADNDPAQLIHFKHGQQVRAPAVRQELEFTDFPLPTIDLWVEGGVLLLPSEH